MNCTEQIGSFIASLRKEKGLTQEDLATQLHITKQAVSRWERGIGYPDIGILESLADLLGVGIDELINGRRNEREDSHAEAITAIRRIISISLSQKADKRYRMLTITEIIMCIVGTLCVVYSSQYSIAMYLTLRSYIVYNLGIEEMGQYLQKNAPTDYYFLYAGLLCLLICFSCLVYQAVHMRRIIRNVDGYINYESNNTFTKGNNVKDDIRERSAHETEYEESQDRINMDPNPSHDSNARSGCSSGS